MNKKYMDFVPVRPNKVQNTKIITIETIETRDFDLMREEIPKSTPKLDVPDDLSARFVKKDVPKRPLNQKPKAEDGALTALKAKNIKARKSLKALKEAEKTPVKTEEMSLKPESKKGTYKAPKAQFINQEKVEKRPLSKNVYKKEEPKNNDKKDVKKHEKAEKPVVIVSKTEKKSSWKTVLAIILTIIVGAAAGVAAFLLLPN